MTFRRCSPALVVTLLLATAAATVLPTGSARAQEPTTPAAPATTPAAPATTPAPSPVTTPAAAPSASPTPPPLPATTPTESHVIPSTVSSQDGNYGNGPGSGVTPRRPLHPGAITTPQTLTTPGDNNPVTVDQADGSESSGDNVSLVGNVKLRYQGYTVTCDRATINTKTGVVTFDNNVHITDGEQFVDSDRVTLDRNNNAFSATEARTVLSPQFVGGNLQQPLRVSGKTIAQEGRNIVLTQGLLTTCDFPNPHYKIGFLKATIIPNDRIVLRKAVLYRYERAILRIDYLSLPIRDDLHYSYLPVVGKNDEEGYFVKNAIGYVLRREFPGILRVDYMTKKGLGLGFDQAYKFSQYAAGTLIAYSVHNRDRGTQEYDYHLNHQQRIGDTISGVLSDYQQNSYLALQPNTTSQNTAINTTRNVGNSATAASLTIHHNVQAPLIALTPGEAKVVGSSSDDNSNNYSLAQTQRIGQNGSVTFRLTGSHNASAYTIYNSDTDNNVTPVVANSGRSEQDGELAATDRFGIFDFTLAANRNLIYRVTGGTAANTNASYAGAEKLPDLTLVTNSDRLKGLILPRFFANVPFQFTFGYGRYSDLAPMTVTTTDQTTGVVSTSIVNHRVTSARSLFDASSTTRPYELTPNNALTLQMTSDFKQTEYTTEYAQYVLQQNSVLTQRLGANSNLNLQYNYLRPYGATPAEFRFDQAGSNNNVTTNLQIVGDRIKYTVGTGYNIMAAQEKLRYISLANQGTSTDISTNMSFAHSIQPFQIVSNQLSLKPSHIFQTRFLVGYDINTGRLVNASNSLRVYGKGGFAFAAETIYNPIHSTIRDISGVLQTPVFSRDLQLTAQVDYDADKHEQKFNYKNFGVIRSFHDYEYVFSYHDQPYGLRHDHGFNIAIRLKAFPITTAQPSSQYGTSINTGTGEVF